MSAIAFLKFIGALLISKTLAADESFYCFRSYATDSCGTGGSSLPGLVLSGATQSDRSAVAAPQ